jgi:hypothetical protein
MARFFHYGEDQFPGHRIPFCRLQEELGASAFTAVENVGRQPPLVSTVSTHSHQAVGQPCHGDFELRVSMVTAVCIAMTAMDSRSCTQCNGATGVALELWQCKCH